MTVPAYTNIAHFRAPYKNSVISGYDGFGAEPVAIEPASATAARLSTQMATGSDGRWAFTPTAKDAILNKLKRYSAIWLGTPDLRRVTSKAGRDPSEYWLDLPTDVKVVPFTEEELGIAASDPAAMKMLEQRSAYNFCKEQAASGRTVLASISIADPSIPMVPILRSCPTGDVMHSPDTDPTLDGPALTEAVNSAFVCTPTRFFPILCSPSVLQQYKAAIGIGGAVALVAVVGGVYWMSKRGRG